MNAEEAVQAYLAAWNEPDEQKRRELLEKAWAKSGTYTDPMSHAEGIDELVQLISEFQQQMPGTQIAISSQVDQHHDQLRFRWRMEGGPQGMDGIHVGTIAEDGKIERIVGFFGAEPPQA